MLIANAITRTLQEPTPIAFVYAMQRRVRGGADDRVSMEQRERRAARERSAHVHKKLSEVVYIREKVVVFGEYCRIFVHPIVNALPTVFIMKQYYIALINVLPTFF